MFSKKEKSPRTETIKSNYVIITGNHVDAIAEHLVRSCGDPAVAKISSNALHEIGFRHPALVISSMLDFLMKTPKAKTAHKTLLFELMHRLISERRDSVVNELAVDCAILALREMTAPKDAVPELQESAASILVALAAIIPDRVLDEMLTHFEPGTVPHYFILKTFGDMLTAEAVSLVPKLKSVLSRLVPIIAGVKHDHLKWVISTVIWQFCEAIQVYVANIEKGSDSTITLTSFSSEFYPMYEVLINKWASTNEKKLRVAVVKAIGDCTSVFTTDQYVKELPRIVPLFLKMLKSEKEHPLPITQGICTVVEVGVKTQSSALTPDLIGSIVSLMLGYVCVQPDYNNSNMLKNYNETLRCFETVTRGNSEFVISFLLKRMETRDLALKCGCLAVFKHIINSVDEKIGDKRGIIVSGVRPLIISETSPIVKRALAQLIVSFASHSYFEVEGADVLLDFIVRICAFEELSLSNKKAQTPEYIAARDLKNMCDSILYLITTTIPEVTRFLWPTLFEFFPKYPLAIPTLVKCLAHIATKKKENDDTDYYVDFDAKPTLPKAPQIIAKLFVSALGKGNHSRHCLVLLNSFGSALVPQADSLWSTKLSELIEKLDNGEQIDLTLEMCAILTETMQIVDDDEWNIALSNAVFSELNTVHTNIKERQGAILLYGHSLNKVGKKDTVNSGIVNLILGTNHTLPEESDCCAHAIAASTNHIDIVLEKIIEYFNMGAKNRKYQSPSTYYNIGYGNEGTLVFALKTTMITAIGYVALKANQTLLTSRADVHIIPFIKLCMNEAKLAVQKVNVFTSLENIAVSLTPSNVGNEYTLKTRDELLQQLFTVLLQPKTELNYAARISALSAAEKLARLPPVLEDKTEDFLLEQIIPFFNLANESAKENDTKERELLWEKLTTVVLVLLEKIQTLDKFRSLLKSLSLYLSSISEEVRYRALECALSLAKKFVALLTKHDAPPKSAVSFVKIGETLVHFLPRCCEENIKARKCAVNTIGMLLYIDHLLSLPSGADTSSPVSLKPINTIRDQMANTTQEDQYIACHDLAKLLVEVISPKEIETLFAQVFTIGLRDITQSGQEAVCIFGNTLSKARGSELANTIPTLISELLYSLKFARSETVKKGAYSCVRALALHNHSGVLSTLLEQPMPHSEITAEAFQTLSGDKAMCEKTINQIMFNINNSRLHEEKIEKKRTVLLPLEIPMSSTCALGELSQNIHPSVQTALYPAIIGTALMRIGTAVEEEAKAVSQRVEIITKGTKEGEKTTTISISPVSQAINTLQSILSSGKLVDVLNALFASNGWALLADREKYFNAIREAAKAIAIAEPKMMEPIYNFMVPFLKGNYPNQRVVTAVVFSEFVSHCQCRSDLLQKLIDGLVSALYDNVLKIHVLLGLGNISANGEQECTKHAVTILDALTSSIEDISEDISIQAMFSLSSFIEKVDEAKVSPILVNLCHRIRPLFEKSNPLLRCSSFALFGSLARCAAGDECREKFHQQTMIAFSSLLVHLYDDEETVQNAVKCTLRKLSHYVYSLTISQTSIANALKAIADEKARYQLEAVRYEEKKKKLEEEEAAKLEPFPEFVFSEETNTLRYKAYPLTSFFEKRPFDEDVHLTEIVYDRVMLDLSKIIVENYPKQITAIAMSLLEYFRVTSGKTIPERLRANSCVAAGLLIAALPQHEDVPEGRALREDSALNIPLLIHSMLSLLEDPSTYVRQKAVETLAILYTF